MDAGIYLAQHYGSEALRLFEGAAGRPEIIRAERLLAWLQSREEVLISLPDIYQFGPKSIRDKTPWISAVSVDAIETAKSATLGRLYLTYFGLYLLGIASFLFVIFCPSEIKRFGSVVEFVDAEKIYSTKPRTSLLVGEVTRDFISTHGEEGVTNSSLLQEATYPVHLWSNLYSVFTTVVKDTTWEDTILIEEDEDGTERERPHPDIYTESEP